MIRVGIISANWGMEAHLPAWHAIEGVEVVAVCTSRQETAVAAAERYGVAKAYWNHADMADDPDIDVIDVGTRPDLRRDMVLEAIRRGKHVFAAANFAANIDAAREMRDAARAAGIVAALDSTIAHAPAHRLAAQMMAEGYVGNPVTVSTRIAMPLFNPASARSEHWRWFGKKAHGASAMRNLGTHSFHLLVTLLGRVEAVVAQATTAVSPWRFPGGDEIVPEVDDTAQLMVRFESGVFGVIQTGWAVPSLAGWRMELNGDRGVLHTTFAGPFPSGPDVRLFAGSKGAPPAEIAIPQDLLEPPGIRFPDPPMHVQSRDIALVMRSIVDGINGRGTASPDFEQAFHVEAILEMARLSIEEKRWVEIAEIPQG